jgi:hypothetical protein
LKSSENLIAVCAAAGLAERAAKTVLAKTALANITPACRLRTVLNKSMSLPLKCLRFVLADAIRQAVSPRWSVDCCTAKNMPNERARSDHAAGDRHGCPAHGTVKLPLRRAAGR